MFRFIILQSYLLSFAIILQADDTGVGPNLLAGNFEVGQPSYNPWAGVDGLGKIHVWPGTQLAAGEDGTVTKLPFSPSIAVGDLNGDGLPDIILADARGFFWFFPNSGKPNAPAFTQGEVMPIWLHQNFSDGDIVPHIQLVDYGGEKKLSLVAGTFAGQLYYIRNSGSATAPRFTPTNELNSIEVPTHSDKLLWCNYLAPFLFDWSETGRLDLIVGDGSYSANSIFLFTNKGSNDHPVFREDSMTKIIPGLGKEQLVPQVIDWNNDGKPDIVTAERAGYIDLYLNQAAEKDAPPVFDMNKFQHVMFGNTDKVGQLATVCAADLNHDGLFDLVVGNPDGTISYSLNIGTLGSPKFGSLVPVMGVYPYTNISIPLSWQFERDRPYGSPNELLEITNTQIDPTFVPPPDFAGKGAMKFSLVKPKTLYFNNQYVPTDMTRAVYYKTPVTLQMGEAYILTLWVRSEGDISDIQWRMDGRQLSQKGENIHIVQTGDPLGGGNNSWSKLTQEIRLESRLQQQDNVHKPQLGTVTFALWFKGDGTLYLDNITLRKAK